MKLIIFILIVLIIAALLIRIILRSVNQHSPLLMQLHAAGIRTGDAERILSSGECWQRQKTLLTEREVSFMKGLFRIVDMKRWYLCPQVRVADIVQLNGNIRPRSRQWWQLFRMVSQWGARRIRKKSYAKVFRASVRAETSRLPVCGSAARRNRRLG